MTKRQPLRAPTTILALLAGALLVLLSGCSTGGGAGASASSGQARLKGDILTLPAGEAVDLATKSAAGKVTIFDFYAEWCAPCKLITPELERLVDSRPDEVALRKVDVIGWGSDAAMKQSIEYLPYLAVVGTNGEVEAIGDDSFPYLKKRFGLDLTAMLTG